MTPIRYEVTNRVTGSITSYKSSARATAAMDRIDAAVCTTRRPIWADAQ